tara:strand:+ start:601 stop:705 length:105 start_codon:yes stop_codon:yes gene_type:complete
MFDTILNVFEDNLMFILVVFGLLGIHLYLAWYNK